MEGEASLHTTEQFHFRFQTLRQSLFSSLYEPTLVKTIFPYFEFIQYYFSIETSMALSHNKHALKSVTPTDNVKK